MKKYWIVVIFLIAILLLGIKIYQNKKISCTPCSGYGVDYFWVDKDNNIILGISQYSSDCCESHESFYYAGENGVKWNNKTEPEAIHLVYGNIPQIYTKKSEEQFNNLIADYNQSCNGCIERITAETFV